MQVIGYSTVASVLEAWDAARRTSKDFESEFGELLINRFIEIQPRAKKFYQTDAMMKTHADGIVALLDSILQMLGPDIEFIQEVLGQVGQRHAKMQVSPSFFPFLGQSLIWALEQKLGEQFTAEHRRAWEETYEAISNEIIKEIVNA
mmetsp:Transcript_15709/g.29970  ORF Transcript_15709/g.29970 Transcript_15709/m.29970 type:complete len:147 (-) Transcript_15709:51-491(-)